MFSRAPALLALLVVPCPLLGLVGCDSGKSSEAFEISEAPDSYPPGPYGEFDPQPGETIENMLLRGSLNLDGASASDLPMADYDMQALRESGATHLLVVTAMGWCSGCRAGAIELGGLKAEVDEARDAGGLVVQLLLQNTAFVSPSDNDLLTWSQVFDLNTSIMRPPNERSAQIFAQREFGYVIDLDTMRIVANTGNRLVLGYPSATRAGMDALRDALGLSVGVVE